MKLLTILLILCSCAIKPLMAQVSSPVADLRSSGEVNAVLRLSDGSILAAGQTAYFNGNPDNQIIRVTPAGVRVPFPVTMGGRRIWDLATDGTWIYLAGEFSTVNGVDMPNLARVNAVTGALDTAWRPAPNAIVLRVIPTATEVFVCGAFTQIGGLARSRVARLRVSGTGRAFETWRADADAQVDAIVLSGSKLYLGGRFKKVNSTNIQYAARVNAADGAVETAWNPVPQFHVFDMAADATHLYCGGSFSRFGASGPPFLTRVNLTSGAVDNGWAPTPDGLVLRVAVTPTSVYASGLFLGFGATDQPSILRAPKASGVADATWTPPVSGIIFALHSDPDGGVWAGGRFDSGGSGSGLAKFSATQGNSAPSYPAAIENAGWIEDIVPAPGGGWFCGGNFDKVNGVRRPALFRLGPDGTFDSSWNPGIVGFGPYVTCLAAIPGALGGAEIQAGGNFNVDLLGLNRYNLLRFKTGTAALQTGFAPQPDNAVQAMVQHGGQWVIGGNFARVNNVSAPHLARINDAGVLDGAWKPEPNATVNSLLSHEGELYVGGEFSTFGKPPTIYPARRLVRVEGLVPDPGWNPAPDDRVLALVAEGDFLYAGGEFTKFGAAGRRHLAQLPLGGAGTPTSWAPQPNAAVQSIALAGGKLHVGGQFTQISGQTRGRLARYSTGAGAPVFDSGFNSNANNNTVTCVAPQTDGSVYVGGNFTSWDGDAGKRTLVRLTGASAIVLPPPGPDPVPGDDLLDLYFASPQTRPTGETIDGQPVLKWEIADPLPVGMVAEVLWSHDLLAWRASGDTADDLTRHIVIHAEESRREARVETSGTGDVSRPLFLRVLVTEGHGHESPNP